MGTIAKLGAKKLTEWDLDDFKHLFTLYFENFSKFSRAEFLSSGLDLSVEKKKLSKSQSNFNKRSDISSLKKRAYSFSRYTPTGEVQSRRITRSITARGKHTKISKILYIETHETKEDESDRVHQTLKTSNNLSLYFIRKISTKNKQKNTYD